MSKQVLGLIAAIVVSGASGYPADAADRTAKHRVAIEYQDLSDTQDVSSAPFVSHAQGFHFFELGKPASVLVQVLAENGNPEFLLSPLSRIQRRFWMKPLVCRLRMEKDAA